MKDKTITVRIDDETNQVINDMSRILSKTKKDILKDAVYQYRKNLFFKQVDDEYAELQNHQEEWAEEQQELREWDAAVVDGIDE
jgi:predicted DNA-binding protein